MSFLTKLLCPKPSSLYRHGLGIQRLKSSQPEVKEQVMVTQLSEELDETEEERESRIEKLRHKSRLSPAHRNMLHGKVPYPEAKAYYHESVQYKRRILARYGEEQSKVYPGISWPDKDDLDAMKEYERVLNPLSIQEMVSIEKNQIEENERQLKDRYEKIIEKDKSNEKFIAEFYKKQERKAQEAIESKNQKERLFSEIRAHFGFNIDPKDEKFQEMIEIKKKEELKKKRMEKKKQREEKLISMALELEQKQNAAAGTGENTEKKEDTTSKKEEDK